MSRTRWRFRGEQTWLWLIVLLALACARADPRVAEPPTDGFVDHTATRIQSVDEFRRMAAAGGGGIEVLKFVITDFSDQERRAVRYLDSAFYELHDEWYWFRLLNGARVPGAAARPERHQFPDPRAATGWAKAQTRLPLDLRLVEGERLYSDRFYELAMDAKPRSFGVGSLVHMPARSEPRPRAEVWAFELQYRDPAGEHELGIFLDALRATLPPEIARSLVWIVRSPEQGRVARRLRERKRPLADRIVDYAELALPGELEVYSTGLVAGRLRLFTGGDPRLADTAPGDILLLDAVPDYLPPAAGVITAVPQTPLAHVAILARNRGIPNAYLGGGLADPNLQQLARVHAPVIVRATESDLQIHPIDEADYQRWLSMRRPAVHRVPGVDLRRAEYTVDVSRSDARELERLRPLVGGKAAGFVVLAATPGVTPPEPVLAVTIRAYAEHLQPLRRVIDTMLADREFQASAKLRMLVLEGHETFLRRFPGETEFARGFGADPRHAAALREIVAAGGLTAMIRERPIAPRTLDHLEQALHRHFAGLAPTQGLRFRSSSTAEDIEGFTGAGLYVSSTGFLFPDQQQDAKDRKHTVAWALARTWASYWSAEAFEERRLAGIDHSSGNMGVLVHPRFDDDKELANGVLTFTAFPPGSAVERQVEINAQRGALSVANPPTDRRVQPERIRVTQARGTDPSIERIAASSESGDRPVLTDTVVRELFEQSAAVAGRWLELEAAPSRERGAEQAPRAIVLDLEFRLVAAGWPALRGADAPPPRLVLKQVRSLEPPLPSDHAVRRLPVPRELLARARTVERRICRASQVSIELLEVNTDPLLAPDLGHAERPFVASVELRGLSRVPGLGRLPVLAVSHLGFVPAEIRGSGPSASIVLRLDDAHARAVGFETIELGPGRLVLRAGAAVRLSENISCTSKSELTTPDSLLLELLQR